jgi:hypothetical protein
MGPVLGIAAHASSTPGNTNLQNDYHDKEQGEENKINPIQIPVYEKLKQMFDHQIFNSISSTQL